MLDNTVYSKLLDVVDDLISSKQRIILEARIKHVSGRAAAKELGIPKTTFSDTLKKIVELGAKRGYAPEYDMNVKTPKTFMIKRISTNYDQDYNIKQQWVIQEPDKVRQYEQMKEVVQALTEDIPKAIPVKYTEIPDDELMVVYPIGDAHIGMYASSDETGNEWGIDESESAHLCVFGELVTNVKPCKKAVIVNLGDYFHHDNMKGVTPKSGNILDTDGRPHNMIDAGFKIMRTMIDSALKIHETVHVINALGNHDEFGELFFDSALANIYENEPRVTVDRSPSTFKYFSHGVNFIGVHHGHSCKPDKLPLVMATDRPADWGCSKHRYWLTGHVHHDHKREYSGCYVESFRTVASKDKYATDGGWRSGQDMKAIILHSRHGEIWRQTANIDLFKESFLAIKE